MSHSPSPLLVVTMLCDGLRETLESEQSATTLIDSDSGQNVIHVTRNFYQSFSAIHDLMWSNGGRL